MCSQLGTMKRGSSLAEWSVFVLEKPLCNIQGDLCLKEGVLEVQMQYVHPLPQPSLSSKQARHIIVIPS